jgi:hypothetical protein
MVTSLENFRFDFVPDDGQENSLTAEAVSYTYGPRHASGGEGHRRRLHAGSKIPPRATVTPGEANMPVTTEHGPVADAPPAFQEWMHEWALAVTLSNRQYKSKTGTGNCTRTDRLLFQYLNIDLKNPLSGVQTEGVLCQSGFFNKVSSLAEARPGDLVFADWSPDVCRANGGQDLGHACVVVRNDHGRLIVVDGAHSGPHELHLGKRYVNPVVLRANNCFYEAYGQTAMARYPIPSHWRMVARRLPLPPRPEHSPSPRRQRDDDKHYVV